MRITTKDIAKLAGVSRGTVDRVLNNRGQVSQEVKEKVLKIARERGYKKNVLASNLARNKKIKISVVLPDPQHDPFWSAPLDGIRSTETYIANYGIELNYCFFNIHDSKSYSKAFDKSFRIKPDAILVAPVFLKESMLKFQLASQNKVAVVCINSEINHSDILCYVGQNSFQCGLLAGKLFNLKPLATKIILAITLGHHSKNAIHINKKIEGLRSYDSLNKCGFEIEEIVLEDFEDEKARQELSKSIIHRKDNIHGIFFTNSRAHKLLDENDPLIEAIQNQIVVGFDLLDSNVNHMNNGNIDFLLNQNPRKQGYVSIINLFNYFIYNKEIQDKVYLPIDIVVKENYQQYLIEEELIMELLV